MSKDKGTKNQKKAPAAAGLSKTGSSYKNEGKVTAPIVIVAKDDKAKGKKG
jgi:hypothetical protein